MQNILRNISFCFKYISGIVGGGVAPIHPPPWHDVGARNGLVNRELRHIYLYTLCARVTLTFELFSQKIG